MRDIAEIENDVFSTFREIETERLILRKITQGDRAALFRLYSDQSVVRYNLTEQFDHISDAEVFIRQLDVQFKQRLRLWWGITLKEHGTVIGTCGFLKWNRTGMYAHCGSMGYDMAQTFWRHGYTSEAAYAVVKFGFEEMCLNRIEADFVPENTAASNLLAKLGFSFEGTLRQRGYLKGEFHDLEHYSLLRSEWEKQSEPNHED
jgi:ribosomal-protein-alanine N-acetyltransferase